MSILVLNTGSSSLKIKIFSEANKPAIISGNLENIGEEKSILHCYFLQKKIEKTFHCPDYQTGLNEFLKILKDNNAFEEIKVIGHRVVHGGEDFSEPVVINQKTIECIQKNIQLAPLHNPANLEGIKATTELFPGIPQIAVFDTAFHQTIPEYAYRYAVPNTWYQKNKIRRYGFHGSSHQYITKEAAKVLRKNTSQISIISIHLGNGASVAAIKNGKSIDTSLGLTPLEGLIMGTRCGDIDPGVIFHMLHKYSAEELESTLNKKSGLYGICGLNDMRTIESLVADGNVDAKLAIDMYTYRIRKYIGAYYALLPSLDAIVFTAGVGENSKFIRNLCCSSLEHLGIKLDEKKNSTSDCIEIQQENSKIKILVIPTNEEMEIAKACEKLVISTNS